MSIKNRLLIWLGIFIFTFFVLPGLNSLFRVQSASDDLFFGENHFYTVIFRGNGEAIVFAKLVFTNRDNSPISSYTFDIPHANPYEMSIYQVVLSPYCIQFDYQNPSRLCLKYQEPDYSYYGNSTSDFRKINFTKEGTAFKLNLPVAVEPNKSSALVIAYGTKDYVKEFSGLFSFNFETIKIPARINNIKVAVDADSDLLLKSEKSQVIYQTSPLVNMTMPAANSQATSQTLGKITQYIGSYAKIMKEAKNLAPNESFVVKGEYANSWLRLYLSPVILTLAVILLIFIVVFLIMKLFNKKASSNMEIKNPGFFGGLKNKNRFNIWDLIFAFLGVMLVIGLSTFLSFWLYSGLSRFHNQLNLIFGIMTIITVLFSYFLAIFGPALTLAYIKGWRSIIHVLLGEFFWFIVILILFLLFSGQTNTYYPTVTPRLF